MRVLIFGGREYKDVTTFSETIAKLHKKFNFECVIEGEAPGADSLARSWAMCMGLPVEPYFAMWERFGDRAGTIRNARMLREGRPDLCIGFPGDKGTADMARRILKEGKPLMMARWSEGPNSPLIWRSFNLQALKVHGNSHT